MQTDANLHIASKVSKARQALVVTLLLSFVMHLLPIIFDLRLPEKVKEIRKQPISIKFIQRAPRLVKPLELTRRPQIVQRRLTQRISRSRAIAPRWMHTAAVHGGTVLASLAQPGEAVQRELYTPNRLELGPEIIAGTVTTAKDFGFKSLDENLLTSRNLDTGRFKAQVFQDPNNKKKISGYFHMDLLRYETNNTSDWDGNPGWNSEPAAVPNVAEAVGKYTDIKMDLAKFIRMDSDELLTSPMVLLTGEAQFFYTKAEADNVGRYLRKGGFLFVDDSSDQVMHGSPFDRSARSLLALALGEDAVFEKLPSSHRLYHCFFDFDKPPVGFDYRGGSGFGRGIHEPYDYLEGIYLDGRLAVLFSNKAYCKFWDHAFVAEAGHAMGDPTRQLQFGVNIVVFALTQPGGIVWQQQRYR